MIGLETVTTSGQDRRRRVANGEPRNDLVFSAHTDGNDDVFPRILGLYVAPGSIVADSAMAIAVGVLLFDGGLTVVPAATYSLIMFATVLPYLGFLRWNRGRSAAERGSWPG